MMWLLFAFLSALFAGLTAILAKCGIENMDSNVATAIRTIVVLIFSSEGIGFCHGSAEWNFSFIRKNHYISCVIRRSNRSIMALLFSCTSDWRCEPGYTD